MHSIASKLARHTSNKITNHVGKIIKSSLGSRSKLQSLREKCRIWSFSVPYFRAFGLNTQPKCRKIRTGKTPNADTFYPVNRSSIDFEN